MEQIGGFDFLRLHTDAKGDVETPGEADAVANAAKSGAYTDVLFIGHGFRNSEGEAEGLYTRFAEGFARHRSTGELAAALGDRRYLVVGVFWPSKKFSEGPEEVEGGVQSASHSDAEIEREIAAAEVDAFNEGLRPASRDRIKAAFEALAHDEGDQRAQDTFVAAVLAAIPFDDADGTEGLEQIRSKSGSEIISSLAVPIILPTVRASDEGDGDGDGGAMGLEGETGSALGVGSFFKGVMGRVGQVLNMGTWYTMKARAGAVGENTVARMVRRIEKERVPGASPSLRVHLVGHSLGGRMMASAARELAADPTTQVASLTLLEAAFSHYGFSASVDGGKTGHFRDVIARQVVKGPLISTFSYQDTVVGKAYAIASRLADDTVKAVGDKDDQFGGIGRNGAQKTSEVVAHPLRAPGDRYVFATGKVNNIDGSGGGITDHSDVTNDKVTYAFAVAMAGT